MTVQDTLTCLLLQLLQSRERRLKAENSTNPGTIDKGLTFSVNYHNPTKLQSGVRACKACFPRLTRKQNDIGRYETTHSISAQRRNYSKKIFSAILRLKLLFAIYSL